MADSIEKLIEAVRVDEREKVLAELARSAAKRMGTRILSADEVVEIFFKPVFPGGEYKISATKLYRLAKLGKIPSFKLDGRLFFDEAALLEWFQSESDKGYSVSVLKHYGRDCRPVIEPIPEKMP